MVSYSTRIQWCIAVKIMTFFVRKICISQIRDSKLWTPRVHNFSKFWNFGDESGIFGDESSFFHSGESETLLENQEWSNHFSWLGEFPEYNMNLRVIFFKIKIFFLEFRLITLLIIIITKLFWYFVSNLNLKRHTWRRKNKTREAFSSAKRIQLTP